LAAGLLACALALLSVNGRASAEEKTISYGEWKARCLRTPANRTLKGRFPTPEQLPLPDFKTVVEQTKQFSDLAKTGPLADQAKWLGAKPVKEEFFDVERSYYTRSRLPFQPFAAKVLVEPGSELIFHGDFHGDIRSFISTLEWLNRSGKMDGFKIEDRNTYLVFLGDYTDRGAYGVEVIYTLLRLKLANPDRVLLARGNHEDFQLTASYGFLQEGQTKYGRQFSPLDIWRIFDFLPVVIYIGSGSDFIQCNHGGMEPGYDAKPLLNASGGRRYQFLGELRQSAFVKANPAWVERGDEASREVASTHFTDFTPKSPTSPAPIGFMWNDYSIFRSEQGLAFNPDRLAFIFGASATRYLLDSASGGRAKLHAVFRAHQHSSRPNPMMNRLIISKGAFRHWQSKDRRQEGAVDRKQLTALVDVTPERTIPRGSVWTFNVSPDSVYGFGNDYSFDTIGVLKTSTSFDKWRLKVVNIPVKLD
jgi:hypothetical protein